MGTVGGSIKLTRSLPAWLLSSHASTMLEIRKLRAERQVADALNMRSGPGTDAIYDLEWIHVKVVEWQAIQTMDPPGMSTYMSQQNFWITSRQASVL